MNTILGNVPSHDSDTIMYHGISRELGAWITPQEQTKNADTYCKQVRYAKKYGIYLISKQVDQTDLTLKYLT